MAVERCNGSLLVALIFSMKYLKSKSKAECEERPRVLKVSEEVKTCEYPSEKLEEWVS